MKPAAADRLPREIGLLSSALLAFNGIVGAGIFALPATLHAGFGAFSPWLFLLFGLAMLVVILPYARLASRFEGSGGPVVYAAPFGRLVSFQAGWLYLIARVAATSANATVFATYLGALVPALAAPAGRAAIITALIGTFTAINMIGLKGAIRALDALTLLKAAPIVGLALWGVIASADSLPSPAALPPGAELGAAALAIFYAFSGFENAVVPAGETREPRRTIPRALIATILSTALLYFLLQWAYVSVMPAGEAPDAPLVAMASLLAGPAGALIITLAALFSVAGNITSSLTSTPRVLYALGRDGMLPGWLAHISARWQTPAHAVLFLGLVGLVLALTGSFLWLAVVSALARMIAFAVCIAALPAVERRAGRKVGAATLLLMLPALAVCFWAIAQSQARSWAMLAGLLALGLALFAAAALRRPSRNAAAPTPDRSGEPTG